MPVSEDELDSRVSSLSQSHDFQYGGISKAEQRKNNKPIMEKRRRARINQCLDELKALILDATNRDPARHTKLEKADILEMTVKHLQSVQRQHLSAAVASDPTVIHKFKTGFNECASEVSRYISSLDGIDTGVKQRLVTHLSSCISGTQPIPLISNAELRNEDSSRLPGLQLIPSRLPTGELALLLPNTSFSSLFPNTLDLSSRSHNSAFIPVLKDKQPTLFEDSHHAEVSSTSNETAIFKPPRPVTKDPNNRIDFQKDLSSERSLFKPLTVYTDPSFDLNSTTSQSHKSPLDFSIRKMSEPSCSKKRPLEDLPCNVAQLSPIPRKSLKLDTVAESSVENQVERTESGNMWRPW